MGKCRVCNLPYGLALPMQNFTPVLKINSCLIVKGLTNRLNLKFYSSTLTDPIVDNEFFQVFLA